MQRHEARDSTPDKLRLESEVTVFLFTMFTETALQATAGIWVDALAYKALHCTGIIDQYQQCGGMFCKFVTISQCCSTYPHTQLWPVSLPSAHMQTCVLTTHNSLTILTFSGKCFKKRYIFARILFLLTYNNVPQQEVSASWIHLEIFDGILLVYSMEWNNFVKLLIPTVYLSNWIRNFFLDTLYVLVVSNWVMPSWDIDIYLIFCCWWLVSE